MTQAERLPKGISSKLNFTAESKPSLSPQYLHFTNFLVEACSKQTEDGSSAIEGGSQKLGVNHRLPHSTLLGLLLRLRAGHSGSLFVTLAISLQSKPVPIAVLAPSIRRTE
jgi:hypothetical protein